MSNHRSTITAGLLLAALAIPASSQAMSHDPTFEAGSGGKKGCKHRGAPGGTMEDGDVMTYRHKDGLSYRITCRDGRVCTTVSGGGRDKTTTCEYDPARFGGSSARSESDGPTRAERK